VQLPVPLCETQLHHSELHKHTRATLVADQWVTAELAVSATIVLIAPVNGPLNRFGMLGCRCCLAMYQAASGLSEEQALVALLCCLSDTALQVPCFSQPISKIPKL
jgi:hypothetical protein